MYKLPTYKKTLLKSKPLIEGEPIEVKVSRMIHDKEPIKDGAQLIFTEKKDGVNAAYNIRTDRWEIATDAMTKILKSKEAKRDYLIKKANDAKEENDPSKKNLKVTGGEPTAGEATKVV